MTIRGSSLVGRSLSAVTAALSAVRDAALDRALDPRNVAKGSWHDLTRAELAELLVVEVGELLTAVESGTLAEVTHEAGDVVWCVAMLLDWRRADG